MRRNPTFNASLTLVVTCLAGYLLPTPSLAAARKLDFQRDIFPILSDNCFNCHGPDDGSRKGGLRLDLREHALRGGKSGEAAIVPGQPDKSSLLARITTRDEGEIMPPPKTRKTLTPQQIQSIRSWIESGAEYRGHWAFTPPVRPAVPAPSPARNTQPFVLRNDIDRFIIARLEKENLAPSAEADRATLLRRLSFDLTGLPPTPQELDAFLKDESTYAYERQVERLLASPHFGEKWARHWLDAARYADSDGYEKDLPRKQWIWRDWVIKAFNRDMPYNQFIIEQIAGDLLPGSTQDQRIATGFLRNGMVNEEGAIIAEQFRLEGLFDRMDTIGKGILGLTIQCAQCHTHKYDPISHEEYYRLLAFINNDYEAQTWVYSSEQLKTISEIKSGIAALEEELRKQNPNWPERMSSWEKELQAEEIPWETPTPLEHEWGGGLAHPEKLPDNSILTLGFRPNDGELWVNVDTKQIGMTGLRLEALTHGDLPFGGPGRSYKGSFAVAEIVVEAKPMGVKDAKWEKLKLVSATADFEQAEQPLEEFFRRGPDDKRKVGPASFLIDGKDETAWGTDRGNGRRHQDLKAVMQFEKPVGFSEGTHLKITLKFRHSGPDIHGRQNNFLGRFRLSLTSASSPKADPLPRRLREVLKLRPDKRTAEQQAALFSSWRSTVTDFKRTNEEIEKLWSRFPQGETVLNLMQREPEMARQTFMLDRGSWQKPAKPVTPGIPAFLHPLAPRGNERIALATASANPPAATSAEAASASATTPPAPLTRLDFARWLVDPRSPTTARVAVNRIWQAIFGTGLVETAEDFGVRASEPSHPELLDYLAVEFMEKNWSTRHLIRMIVSSSAYRQSSRTSPQLLERDPNNRLLARGPRFRAEAEMVRDAALRASGLLNPQVGGPSFFPPVPDSVLALSFLKVDFWQTATAPDRYRRSLYVFRRRSIPDPMLATFDAPNGDFACARRARSNTPLAALAAMNESVMVEAAQALALRILREGGSSARERAAYGFRLCTSRPPTPGEIDQIVLLYESRKQRVADGWVSAREISTGDASGMPALPAGATPTEAAAWTVVSRVLLNLDEAVTKN